MKPPSLITILLLPTAAPFLLQVPSLVYHDFSISSKERIYPSKFKFKLNGSGLGFSSSSTSTSPSKIYSYSTTKRKSTKDSLAEIHIFSGDNETMSMSYTSTIANNTQNIANVNIHDSTDGRNKVHGDYGDNDSDSDNDNDNDDGSSTTTTATTNMSSKMQQQNHEIKGDSSIQSIILLNFVAVIWGTQHSFIKMVVEDCDSSIFSFTRFILAALIATVGPLLFGSGPANAAGSAAAGSATNENENENSAKGTLDDDSSMDINNDHDHVAIIENDVRVSDIDNNESAANENVWRWGIEMGFWMFLGYAFQAIGLEYTTAQRSGFLLYLNIKLVPLFAYLIYQRQISIPTWISALTALTGTALLTFDGSAYDFNIGDAWSIAAAAASAMFILRLEFASKAVSNSSKLNSYSLWAVTLASFLWCLYDGMGNSEMEIISSTSTSSSAGPLVVVPLVIESTWNKVIETISRHPFELVYLGGVTTALANYIQTKAQKGISAERASIIYALDPVYGAVFANLLLGEQLTQWGVGGATLITIAAATNAFLDLGGKEKETSKE